jgi:hypothetical protein
MKNTIKLTGKYCLTFRNKKKEITKQFEFENLVVNLGLNIIAKFLAGDNSTSGQINYCALGIGNETVQNNNTKLSNEIFRKTISAGNYSNNVLLISTFFDFTEANQKIKEIGLFVDGEEEKDSGILFSRISTEHSDIPITKQDTETLTIDYSLTLVNA